MEGGEEKAKAKVATVTRTAAKAEVTDKVKETAKDGGETSPTPPKSRGRGNSQKRWGNAGKRQDGEKSKEKTPVAQVDKRYLQLLRQAGTLQQRLPKEDSR